MIRPTIMLFATLQVAGCGAQTGGATPVEPQGSRRASSPGLEVGAPGVVPTSAAAASGVGATQAAASGAEGEEIIREFLRLDDEGVARTELERFLAEHPGLLSAEAPPYGRALMWALEFEHAKAALVLIRAGAKVQRTSSRESSPLHLAARGGLDEVVRELLTRGASPQSDDYWGTPLHFAAANGHASTMRLLLKAGADPNAHAADHRYTPLHEALIDRHVEAVRVLIDAKADLDARDDDGQTPLHWGGFAYRPQAVHLYRDLGAPHDTRFVDAGPAEAMKLLLEAGASIEATDAEGNTPLHAAAQVGSRRGVEMLLAHGARRSAKNHAGLTAADIAKRRGDDDIAKLLR